MRNNKGYSLIELLGALVIIGLILLIVIPAVSRLLTSNDSKEYNNYLKIIETGAKRYAEEQEDDLGSGKDIGCIEVSIDDLISEGFIKKFEDKDITCTGKVRLNNSKGKLKVSINLTCSDNKGKETFKKAAIEDSNCIAFIPRDEGALNTVLVQNGVGSGGSIEENDNKWYVKGSNPNNYVWYSGKLWRVVWYDNNAVKLIADEIVTVMPRNSFGMPDGIKYENSLVDIWLNNTFLPTLKDYDDYLIDTEWDVSPTSGVNFLPDKLEVVNRKVGLLNSYETAKMGSFISSGYRWLLSNYYGRDVRYANGSGAGKISSVTYYGPEHHAIRPAITMKADVFVLSGDGSENDPYILEGNSTYISKGTLLNTRYSGEYLKINNELYRIVKTNGQLTKVIMVNSLPERVFDTEYHNFSYSSLLSYLRDDWYVNSLGSDKQLVFENGSWCFKTVSDLGGYLDKCAGDSFVSPIGLPSLGDLYTANNFGNSDTFWTIDVYLKEANVMHVISNDKQMTRLSSATAKVKPVMYLKENVVINSGDGTMNNPYVLGLK
ncbi:MAG: prepilin-type N-terminal cleavage/methylation domain-containing protein [Bacilli bacterium]|nr:prepilin-type N-terminal cleavage/methylation domain-containing protein [Bacilli bacterium]